ncbi:MAG: hypothetical protein QM758_25825 [Armatimonas sp.]
MLSALLIAGGCKSGGPGSTTANQPVFVDMAALQSRHPLAGELARLRSAGGGVSVSAGTPGGSWAGALPATSGGGLESGTRRFTARTRLADELIQAEAKEAEARAKRRARRLEQRRAELLASERGALAEQQRLLQEQSDLRTRAALDAKVGTLSHLEIAEQIYRAQLRDGVLGPADPDLTDEEIKRLRPLVSTPPTDAASLRETVNLLKGPIDFMPAPRSRMTVMAEAAGGAARQMRSQMNSIWNAGLQEREEVARKAREEMEARVEERLKQIASQRPRTTQNRSTIRQELAETLQVEQTLAGKRVQAAGGKQVAFRVPATKGTQLNTGNRAALMEQLLAEDVRARVKDAAQRQGLALRAVRAPGVPDRTSQIGGWVGLLEGREVKQ